jgi:5'-methylthioadenosine phosphorylase
VLKADVAVIGGTGVGERLASLGGALVLVPTPFGPLRGRVADLDGRSLFIVQRHSSGHKVPPHAVAYEAIADGLRRLGVKGCLASAAVGSLVPEWGVGTFASCTDFLDATGSGTTLFNNEVRHTDFSLPFPLAGLFQGAESPCVYACMSGPRYETPFEVATLAKLGAHVVGMTAALEAIAMRESGVPYGCLAVVTNLACGLSESELSHDEVGDAMKSRGEDVVMALLQAARSVT